jgi:hypothetical protein
LRRPSGDVTFEGPAHAGPSSFTAMPTLDDQIRWFTHRRQRLRRAAPDPASALRAIVAVPSAHPSAPLALHARSATFDVARFRALDALRLPAMRGQVHLLPRETAHLALRAVPEQARRAAERLAEVDPDGERLADLRATILRAAITPRSPRELRALTGGDRALAPVLAVLAHTGELVRTHPEGLRSNELRYAAAAVPDADPDKSLAWLADAYLAAHGPARPADLASWAGVEDARAAAALASLDTEELDGGLLVRAADRAELDAAVPVRDVVDLLPKGDPHLMGYAPDGRVRLGDPSALRNLYDDRGESLPAVLVNGVVAGTWGLRADGGAGFEASLLEPVGPRTRAEVDDRLRAVALLLGSR